MAKLGLTEKYDLKGDLKEVKKLPKEDICSKGNSWTESSNRLHELKSWIYHLLAVGP